MAAARITENTKEDSGSSSRVDHSQDNPSIFASQAKGPDLHRHMSELDPLNDDIQKGYANDKVFKVVLEKPEDHPDFDIRNRYIWRKNRGGEDILCVPS